MNCVVNPDTSLPEGITGWTLRLAWPIEDDAVFDREAIAAARADMRETAHRCGAVVVGEPKFTVADNDGTDPRITTPTVVVCVVAAVPTWRCWPEIIEELAEKGWSDPHLAELLHTNTERVRGIRRRNNIPSGVSPGWASATAPKRPVAGNREVAA